jgi:hypothetical protein
VGIQVVHELFVVEGFPVAARVGSGWGVDVMVQRVPAFVSVVVGIQGVHRVVAAEGLPVAARAFSFREDDVRAKIVPAFLLAMPG